MSTRTTPDHWDQETDFLSIGAGIGGLAGAIAASAWGLDSVVIEKGPTVGGVTAFSGGQLWVPANHFQEAQGIEDSLEEGYEYIAATSAGLHDSRLTWNYLVHAPLALRWFAEQAGVPFAVIPNFPDYYYPDAPASRANGRYVESAPFDAKLLGEWQERTHVSPQMISGLTMAEAVEHGGNMAFAKWDRSLFDDRRANDIRTYGPGLGAGFVKAALDRGASLLVDTAAEELIVEDGRVVGVRALRDGRDYFIRARRGVLIAAGGYDWNSEAHKSFSMIPDVKAAGPASVTGDAIRMAGMMGARIAQVPQPLNAGFGIEGEELDGVPLWRLGAGVIGVPHAIAVNRKGRRFAEESFYRSVGFALKKIDGATMEFENYPFWAIQDSQARQRYAVGPYGAGEDLPEHVAIRADSIRELAERAGIDPDGLEAEVARFNSFVRDGVDRDFHRGERPWSALSFGDITIEGNSNLGAIEQAPFYAVKMIPLNIGLSNAGLVGDENNRVIDWNGEPIDGLYVAGNSMALTEFGAGYTSGQANTRGMLGGYLAARHAAGDPSTALAEHDERIAEACSDSSD